MSFESWASGIMGLVMRAIANSEQVPLDWCPPTRMPMSLGS